MKSIIRSIVFSSLLILVPYALVPHAGTPIGYLGNAAIARACPVEDFVVAPSSRTVEAGVSAPFQVTVYLQKKSFLDFHGPIIISATNLPSGVSSSPIEVSDDNGDRIAVGTLSIDSTCHTTAGTYRNIKITADAILSDGSHDPFGTPRYVTLVVTTPSPCFSVDAHEKRTIKAGEETFFTTVVKWCEGYAGDVTLSVDENSLPAGVTYTFDSNPVSPKGNSDKGNAETKLRIHSTCDTPPGEYTIKVKGMSGGVEKNDTVTLAVTAGGDFSISAEPTSQEIDAGARADYTITGEFTGCFSGPAELAVDREKSTLPNGTTWYFEPDTSIDKASNTAILKIQTPNDAAPGSYRAYIKGTGGPADEKEIYVDLVIKSKPQDFTLSAEPTSREIKAGDKADFKVTGDFTEGFTGDVELSFTGTPSGLSGSFSPKSISAGDRDSTLTITTAPDTKPGRYEISITGTHPTLGTRTTKATLTVIVESDFALSANPTSREIKPGETAQYTITVNDGGSLPPYTVEFPDPMDIGDLIATIDPSSLPPYSNTNSVTLTIDTAPSVQEGTYTITVNARGNGHSASVDVTLVVGKPAESAGLTVDKSVSPSSAKVGQVLLYTVEIANTGRGTLKGVVVRDNMPAGVGYVKGSAVIDGRSLPDPSGATTLVWEIGDIPGGDTVTLRYHGVVKPNVSRGKSTNTVIVTGTDPTGRTLTARDSADIGVSSEELERKGKIKGKVFIDENGNGLKNVDEEEVAGVWIILESGERTTTDEEGLFQFDEVDSGEHLVGVDLRRLPKEYYVVGDGSKIVSLFSGGTGRTYFGLGRTGPSKKELEEIAKAEVEKKTQAEEALKAEEKKKEELEKKEAEERLPKGTISGKVYIDKNGNERYDLNEKVIERVIVVLDGSKRNTTDKNGKFSFKDVIPGEHTLKIYEDKEFKKSYEVLKKETKVTVKALLTNKADIAIREAGKGLEIEIHLSAH